jgi:prepilin-type N-terminal cleavage/methylation domain-containing protein
MAGRSKACGFRVARCNSNTSGFTLLETIIVTLVIGFLVAIATPGWLHWLNVLSLNAAQDEIYQAIRKAQQNARHNRVVWEFDIRQTTQGEVQWTIFPGKADPSKNSPETLVWRSLDSRVQIDPETTLLKTNDVYRVQFNHLGAVNGQLGRVTFSAKSGGKTKRCVIISTLLGAVRTGSDQSKPANGKYCR